jgi:hypothetical protein
VTLESPFEEVTTQKLFSTTPLLLSSLHEDEEESPKIYSSSSQRRCEAAPPEDCIAFPRVLLSSDNDDEVDVEQDRQELTSLPSKMAEDKFLRPPGTAVSGEKPAPPPAFRSERRRQPSRRERNTIRANGGARTASKPKRSSQHLASWSRCSGKTQRSTSRALE